LSSEFDKATMRRLTEDFPAAAVFYFCSWEPALALG